MLHKANYVSGIYVFRPLAPPNAVVEAVLARVPVNSPWTLPVATTRSCSLTPARFMEALVDDVSTERISERIVERLAQAFRPRTFQITILL